MHALEGATGWAVVNEVAGKTIGLGPIALPRRADIDASFDALEIELADLVPHAAERCHANRIDWVGRQMETV